MKFEKAVMLPGSVPDVLAWHARPGAFLRLSPPWQPIRLLKPNNGIEAGATLAMRLSVAGPLGITWNALHEPTRGYLGFRDIQTSGPFNRWEHDHVFESASATETRLVDRVSYRLPLWPVSQPLAGWAVRSMLRRTFTYRHEVTHSDLTRHAAYATRAPLTVAVTGASGMLGAALTAFLTAGGHRVMRLVRGAATKPDEVHWNATGGAWDASPLEGCDAVIHLAGENIASRRWSRAHKQRVLESRTLSTKSLIGGLRSLERRPKAFLCASATGYYGASREGVLSENAEAGQDFLAEVCRNWEEAAREAESIGIRAIQLRIGVVLSPLGGALQKLLPAFQLGVGGAVGPGTQTMSWISIDDVVYAIHHLLMRQDVSGAFNLTAPNPISNAQFARTLGKVLQRPSVLTLPALVVKLVFGEMGKALLLGSIDARPARLDAIGYRFEYPELEDALRHTLGRR